MLLLGAAEAPARYAHQNRFVVMSTDKRPARITLARVLASLCLPGAEHVLIVEVEFLKVFFNSDFVSLSRPL